MKPYKWTTALQMLAGKSQVNLETGCIEWVDCLNYKGYGNISASIWGKYYSCNTAHQLAYTVAYGFYDKTFLICHKCNNRKCVNPSHLYKGTHKDNNRDKAQAGSAKGSRNPGSKLKEDEVVAIKKLLDVKNNVELGKMFNINSRTISNIRTGVTWSHITGVENL